MLKKHLIRSSSSRTSFVGFGVLWTHAVDCCRYYIHPMRHFDCVFSIFTYNNQHEPFWDYVGLNATIFCILFILAVCHDVTIHSFSDTNDLVYVWLSSNDLSFPERSFRKGCVLHEVVFYILSCSLPDYGVIITSAFLLK